MSLRIHTDMTNMRICTIHGNKRIFTVLHLGIQFAPLAGSRNIYIFLHCTSMRTPRPFSIFELCFQEKIKLGHLQFSSRASKRKLRPSTLFSTCFHWEFDEIYTYCTVLPRKLCGYLHFLCCVICTTRWSTGISTQCFHKL